MSDVLSLSGISGLSCDSFFPISCLIFVPSPLTLSVLSLLCEIMVHSPDFFSRQFLDMFHYELGFFLYSSG